MAAKATSKGYATVPKEGDDSVYKIPVPTDSDGNVMSYEDAATTFERWTMKFMNPIFVKGISPEGIVHSDLGKVSEGDKASNMYVAFWDQWLLEAKKPAASRSLWRVLWRSVGYGRMAYALGLYAIFTALNFLPVFALKWLMSFLEGSMELTPVEMWMSVATMFVIPCISSVIAVQSNTLLAHTGIDFRNALTMAIYNKAMVMSPSARNNTSTGQVLNMFATDTRQIQAFLFFMNNVVMAPPQIAVALWLIYGQVGNATWVGLGFMLLMAPINATFFQYLTYFRKSKQGVTDTRVKIMNEVLSGIRIIKYYAWEVPFADKVKEIRSVEVLWLKKIAYLVAGGFTLVLMAVPLVQPIVTFYTYIQLGNELTGTIAFTTIALFNVMQLPFAFLPMGLSTYSQSLVSCKRMQDFFAAEELSDYVSTEESELTGAAVGMKDAKLFWTVETEEMKKKMEEQRDDSIAVTAAIGTEAKVRKSLVENIGYEMVPIKRESGRIEPADSAKSEGHYDGKYDAVIKDIAHSKDAPTDADGAVPAVAINRSCHTLMNMSFDILQGQLVAIVGPVGSGKSSLLQAMLGEMILETGSVWMKGDVAYSAQQPWVMNETLKENILFGRPYDERLFDAAVHAASLEDDISILPGGILTEIGEKGINLSGGQKARVSLARAIYRNADVYLLDDPLSAVDAHVGQHIFEECILKELSGKTRLLVTHHVHILPLVDHILLMEDGRIKAQGSFEDLKSSGIDIGNYVAASEADPRPRSGSATSATSDNDAPGRRDRSGSSTSQTSQSGANDSSAELAKSAKKNEVKEAKATERHQDTRKSSLMTMEERKLGDVSASTYIYYLKSGGWSWFAVGLGFQVIAQIFQVASSFWLSEWGAESVELQSDGMGMSTKRAIYYIDIMAALSMTGLACTFTRALLVAQHRVTTSRVLHADLLRVVTAAPIWFFDSTPLGRIMNRFSSDMSVIDEELSQTIGQITNSLFNVLGAALAVAAATKGTFLVLLIPLVYIYSIVQSFFRKTNTTVARLAAVSLSPVYAEFSQALSGTVSIRAYDDVRRFTLTMENKLDTNTIALVTQQLAGQWLAIRLDIIGSIISCFVALITVATRDSGFIPAGWMGLGLTYSFQITSFLKFCVRIMATGEAQMNAVERIMYYCENMEQEETLVIDDGSSGKGSNKAADGHKRIVSTAILERTQGKLNDFDSQKLVPRFEKIKLFHHFQDVLAEEGKKYANWPSDGAIEFKDIEMSYHTGPPVLKGISIAVPGGAKIGVCGRTGSGKSSLMVSLFRIEEVSSGAIFIDGVDISSVPVSVLRSKIGIIPQDPVMFSVTVRFNLDPFSNYTDVELWDALGCVNMKGHVETLPSMLDEVVAEGGENFSAGQRQLLCIARALLRKPKILVLDEATASIDNETDAFVQEMIRKSFKECTILTIAHRLHTIIDSDKILVLEEGNMAEYDTPKKLLSKSGDKAIFKSLWQKHQDAQKSNN